MGRFKLAAVVIGLVLLGATTALASTVFGDVDEDRFYAEAVEWAFAESVTMGTTSSTFSPDDPATRGQSVTFMHRYDQSVVQPALVNIDAQLDAVDNRLGVVDTIRQSPERVVWVADDDSGDYSTLSQALASITDASESNPYVVRIAPGVYVETSPVALKSHVDIEGSGQGITTITCECGGGGNDGMSATLAAGDIATEIRHLTVTNSGGAYYSFGVWTEGIENEVSASVSMLHVTATATGGNVQSHGIYNWQSSPSMTHVSASGTGSNVNVGVYNGRSDPSMMNVSAAAVGTSDSYNFGVFNNESSPLMTDVLASATGGAESFGVRNVSSSPSMTNVSATGTNGSLEGWGVYNVSSHPTIQNSSFAGDSHSILNDGSSSAALANTMLDGTPTGSSFQCVGAYSELFVALDTQCTLPAD